MKTIKLTALLLASLLVMNGCASETIDEPKNECPHIGYSYTWLYLSFQDALGNDLVKGLGFTQHDGTPVNEDAAAGVVKPLLYRLEVIFHGIMEPWHPFIPPGTTLRTRPTLHIATPRHSLVENYYHLFLAGFRTPMCDADWNPVAPASKITLMLTLPHIFGDNVAREIVTHWRPHPIPEELYLLYHSDRIFPYLWHHYCYRIEFDGKEFVTQSLLRHSGDGIITHVGATIVLGGE